MSCVKPILRIDENYYNRELYRLPVELRGKPVNSGVLYSYDLKYKLLKYFKPEFLQQIRCGQCADCRLNYSRVWAERCMLESQLWQHNYFVTLTYDDFHLPYGEFLDYDGEVKDTSLILKHCQDFMKRLRTNVEREFNHTGIRCFYCGEYGELNGRPHYHFILFNMPDLFPTFKFYKKVGSVIHYKSDVIEKAWSDKNKLPLGFHTICDVTYDTCAYTARYVMKKQKGQEVQKFKLYDNPELNKRALVFCKMSNRPGIAKGYYDEHKEDIYRTDSIYYQREWNTYRSRPPRYFDKLYDIDEPMVMQNVRYQRINSAVEAQARYELQASESEAERLARLNDKIIRDNERKVRVL